MTSDKPDPVLLAVLFSEAEAHLMAARLDGEKIEAWIEGGTGGDFRAEAPGRVRVFVDRADLERAKTALTAEGEAPPPPTPPTTRHEPIPVWRWRYLAWGIIGVTLAIILLHDQLFRG